MQKIRGSTSSVQKFVHRLSTLAMRRAERGRDLHPPRKTLSTTLFNGSSKNSRAKRFRHHTHVSQLRPRLKATTLKRVRKKKCLNMISLHRKVLFQTSPLRKSPHTKLFEKKIFQRSPTQASCSVNIYHHQVTSMTEAKWSTVSGETFTYLSPLTH